MVSSAHRSPPWTLGQIQSDADGLRGLIPGGVTAPFCAQGPIYVERRCCPLDIVTGAQAACLGSGAPWRSLRARGVWCEAAQLQAPKHTSR